MTSEGGWTVFSGGQLAVLVWGWTLIAQDRGRRVVSSAVSVVFLSQGSAAPLINCLAIT